MDNLDGIFNDVSYIQKNMAKVEWYLFANPFLLSSVNAPIFTPNDLTDLPLLGFGWQKTNNLRALLNQHVEQVDVSRHPGFCSVEMWTLKRAAEKSGGVVSLPSYVCKVRGCHRQSGQSPARLDCQYWTAFHTVAITRGFSDNVKALV